MYIFDFADQRQYPYRIEHTPGTDHRFLARVLLPTLTNALPGFGATLEEALEEALAKEDLLEGFVRTHRIFYYKRWNKGHLEPVEKFFEANEVAAHAIFHAEQDKMWAIRQYWTTSQWTFGRVLTPGHIIDLMPSVVTPK